MFRWTQGCKCFSTKKLFKTFLATVAQVPWFKNIAFASWQRSANEFCFTGNQKFSLISLLHLQRPTFGSGTCHDFFIANAWSFFNLFQWALARLNSSKILSGRSATHQKATFPLLCFQKLLMLLNPFKILREWQIHMRFPWRAAKKFCTSK